MTDFVTLTLRVEIDDPALLWDAANVYLTALYGKTGHAETIGTREEPKLGACVAQLLDRSEHLGPGAEIVGHRYDDDE